MTDYKGLVGDPWMVVSNNANARGTPPAFLGRRKFNYDRIIQGLTSPDWKRPVLLDPSTVSGDSYLVARGMIRGEGRTEGYYERIIRLRPKIISVFGAPQGPQLLGDLSRQRIDQIAIIQRALRFGVTTFAAGGATEGISDEHRSRANPWADRFNQVVDASFFEDLQDELEKEEEERQYQRRMWATRIVSEAEGLLEQATRSLPCRKVTSHKAKAASKRAFWGMLRGASGIPDLLRPGDETKREEE